MATTIPPTFTGTPTLTGEKVSSITEWLRMALGDRDKADLDDHDYHDGQAEAYESVLTILHDAETTPAEPTGTEPTPDTPERRQEALDAATDAFWQAIATAYPEVTTGDLAPGEDAVLGEGAERSLAAWLYWNQPNVEVLIEGSYADDHQYTRTVTVTGPTTGQDMEEWWNEQVYPHTGDGRSADAFHEATIQSGPLSGTTYEWMG